MHAQVLEEPELEFGGSGRHIDPRHGIASYGPVDAGTGSAPSRIRVGVVGPGAAVEGIRGWLARAREPISAKPARYPGQARLFPAFPGFDLDHSFRCVLAMDERQLRVIPARVIDGLSTTDTRAAVQATVDAYLTEIEWLAESNACDVIVCHRPPELDAVESEPPRRRRRGDAKLLKPDFHDQLKAAALPLNVPLQVMRPETYDEEYKPPPGPERRRVQDPATRAWNLHTALYLKAGGAPWRLIRSFADRATCYLGVSFFRGGDGEHVNTSVAQMFNERGEGVVVRGVPAAFTKDDKRPYLPEQDAHDLLVNSLTAYRAEHGHFPARLVIHKTSMFRPEEQAGFRSAALEHHIDQVEMIWVHEADSLRMFRPSEHPPLRGTLLTAAHDRLVLYTKGSVDFYETWPGSYIPDPITLRPVDAHHRPEILAAETLSLTKLNWNHSQLDGRLPITLRASRKVAAVLRHVPAGEPAARRYHFYM